MSSEGKVLEEGREEPSHETPQAITITIMDPSALETTTLDPTLVTSMQAQDTDQGMSTLLVMPREGHRTKDILQTVTETHMGTQELPVISSISNTEEESQQSTIQVMSKSQDDVEGEGILAGVGEAADEEEGDEGDDLGDPLSQHCLICNFEMATNESEKPIPVFKSQTSTTHRKMAVFLGTLVGQKLTSRKAHSDIICRRCFNLLDKVDALEVEIRDTKEEIITKFQETVTAYGGRARRRKPATAKKSDYVFPKVEPEEDILGLEMDENFEPRMEDLLEEEQDHREDRTIQDEEWEPEFKRPKIKREPVEPDPNGPPKRKRGRPRKDASKPKGTAVAAATSTRSLRRKLPDSPAKTAAQTALAPPLDQTQKAEGDTGTADKPRGSSASSPRLKEGAYCSSDVHCPACTDVLPSLALAKEHFKKVHSDLKAVRCAVCNEEVKGRFMGYLSHLRTQHKDRSLAEVAQDGEVRAARGQVEDGTKCRECKVCHKKVRASLFSRHVAKHKRVPCPECKTLLVPHCLKRHINDCHTKKISYPCPECPAVFHDASNLLSHRKRNHLGQAARRHLCEVCGKKFVMPSDLRTHVAGVHHNVRKFVCEFCGLRFKISSQLTYHRRMHTGEKPHVCQVCEQSFAKPNVLAKHMRRVHRQEYHGKYRKRLQASESQAAKSESAARLAPALPKKDDLMLEFVHVDQVVERLEDVVAGGPVPPVAQGVSRMGDGDGSMVVAPMYSLAEDCVEPMAASPAGVPIAGASRTIHGVGYFRPDDRSSSPRASYDPLTPSAAAASAAPSTTTTSSSSSASISSSSTTQTIHTIPYFRPSTTEEQYIELLPTPDASGARHELRLDAIHRAYVAPAQPGDHQHH